MPAITTRGAASAKAFGWSSGGGPVTYIEDVFSTYLYTGNASTQTITNGIDLSTKGGMVWSKSRSNATNHVLRDTVRGNLSGLNSNQTSAQTISSVGYDLTSFNSTGFSLGPDFQEAQNTSGNTYASWTFREQPKFFDVVTYTGTGANRTIAHNLGSVPGCMFIKRTDTAESWIVYHRSLTSNYYYLVLNSTAGEATDLAVWNGTTPTSSVFSVGTNVNVNASGGTYVAYLFAHNAGGFGLTGANNVISCGSFTTDGSGNATVNLGYEPQWIFYKESSNAGNNWSILDSMRGFDASAIQRGLNPNTSGAENNEGISARPSATGFTFGTGWYASRTFIYIAIRRGPMKVPTVGTTVYNAIARTGTGANATVTGVGFAPDLVIAKDRNAANGAKNWDRLRGATIALFTYATSTENTYTDSLTGFDTMDGFRVGIDSGGVTINTTTAFANWCFRRAPGFFDEVCYTGTGSNTTNTHNLGVAPELWIVKGRSGPTAWTAGSTALANTEYLVLNTTAAKATDATAWNSTFPSSSVFSLGSQATVNTSADTYVAYLFATCAGVSKVGTYTGNGSNQTIACGFAAGSRFVMIKRTDSTGDWYVWDSTRGIVAGNDPHLSLNATAAEVTTDDSVDTDNSGFIVNQLAATNINVTSATYIFLAIA